MLDGVRRGPKSAGTLLEVFFSICQGEAPMDSSATPKFYRGHEQDLTQELLAYYQLCASSISDPDQLEQLVDELCCSQETLRTDRQAELRRRQCQFVKNLLKEKERVVALREVYEDAMDQAFAIGGEYYRDTATRLTELQAEAHVALEGQKYHSFSQVLEKMKGLDDQASRLLEGSLES
jgi:hypothetical protein